MTFVIFGLVIVVAGTVRIIKRHRRQPRTGLLSRSISDSLRAKVSLIIAREVRERVRGKVFKIGTLFILLVVAAAIVIPVLNNSNAKPQQIGIVGTLSSSLRATV